VVDDRDTHTWHAIRAHAIPDVRGDADLLGRYGQQPRFNALDIGIHLRCGQHSRRQEQAKSSAADAVSG
jgi:hypothetical protein